MNEKNSQIENTEARKKLKCSGIMGGIHNRDIEITAGKVLASWIPTFHRGYARYSPGVVMHLALARKAAETGITRIELGRGENQMKACLMSGAIPVAIGSIELRPFHKALWAGYYGSRRILHSSLLRGTLLPFTRRIRNSVRAY